MQVHWSDQEDLVPLLPLSGESGVEQAGWSHTIRLARHARKSVNTVMQLNDCTVEYFSQPVHRLFWQFSVFISSH